MRPPLRQLLLTVMLVAAGPADCRDSSRDRAATAALSAYAPDLEFGMSAWRLRRLAGHRFTDAPYVGLRDSAYRGPDGFGDLFVSVDPSPDNDAARTSSFARATTFTLSAPDSASAARAEARLTGLLGPPRVRCYPAVPVSRRTRGLAWGEPKGRGVLLVHPLGSWTYLDSDARGTRPARDQAQLTIGTEERLDSIPGAESCK